MNLRSFVPFLIAIPLFAAVACAQPAPDGIAPDPKTAASPPTASPTTASTPLHWSQFPIVGGPPCKYCDPSVTKVDCPADAATNGACTKDGASCLLRCDPTSCPAYATCRGDIPN